MSKTRTTKAQDAMHAARGNPYVQRVVEDAELRRNVRDAFDAARSAYGRITGNGKGPVKAVTKDKKVQRDLRSAADSLREASEQLRGAPKRKKGFFGKAIMVGVVGAGVTLAVSENARKALMDALFGAEEEFEYTSTTTPPTSGNGAS